MKLEFEKSNCAFLDTLVWEPREQEQTLEVKLPDGMPDIGTILGAWGQIVLRGKEWHSKEAQVNGGIMAWVLYTPEDGSDTRSVEAWMPFQMKWDLPETDREGTIRMGAMLRSLDARTVSARKMMLRGNISAVGEVLVPTEVEISTPGEVPEGVELLRSTYPTLLPLEAGEKTFLVDEELTLPSSVPALEKILRFEAQPEILDSKVMAGKLVFRGTLHLHILYRSDDGNLQGWDFELPFSQFSELEGSFAPEAESTIVPAVTNLELENLDEGSLHLKCGLVAQYTISDRVMVNLVEDGYSVSRGVQTEQQTLRLPGILDVQSPSIHAEATIPAEGRVVDATFLPTMPKQRWAEGEAQMECGGTFRVLYYDGEGKLQCASTGWESPWSIPASQDSTVRLMTQCASRPQVVSGGGSMTAKSELSMLCTASASMGIPMVTALELGEAVAPDPGRPSLILRRAGEESLWEIAKASGSTVEAIRQANHLQDAPEVGQMLLIPVS